MDSTSTLNASINGQPLGLMQLKILTDGIVAQLKPLLLESRGIQPRLLTIKQAAVYIGRSEQATYRLAALGPANGGLPSVRSDGRVMLDRLDLDAWIESNKC